MIAWNILPKNGQVCFKKQIPHMRFVKFDMMLKRSLCPALAVWSMISWNEKLN